MTSNVTEHHGDVRYPGRGETRFQSLINVISIRRQLNVLDTTLNEPEHYKKTMDFWPSLSSLHNVFAAVLTEKNITRNSCYV